VPDLLLFCVDDQVALSEWGDLVWRELQSTLYGEQLHPSPSDKLVFGKNFASSTEGLDARRLRQINAKVDDLARFLEVGELQRSLDFKILQGGARQGSTHEMDAWTDGSAKRLFGHHEAGHFVLDRLDAALH